MERLMTLRLQAQGCAAEAWLNGLPLARVGPGQPTVCLAVHEYALSGLNRLELLVAAAPAVPPPPPGAGAAARPVPPAAQLQLLLPRVGAPVDDTQVRTLAALGWPDGDERMLPARRTLDIDLPLNFPRWRWLDAPQTGPAEPLLPQVLAFIGQLAADLARGDTTSFLAATRLRTGELALAYQREPRAETQRLRDWLEQRHADGVFVWAPLDAAALRLRSVAGGRLLDCLTEQGQPALRTEPDAQGQVWSLPLRIAVVEGNLHMLR